jgi:effector-binding domain-containing protein
MPTSVKMASAMSYSVEIRRVEAQPILAVTKRVPRTDLVDALLGGIGEVWNRVRQEGIKHAGRNVGVYRNGDAETVEVEAGVELLPGHELPAERVSWTPAGLAASVVHVGSYSGIPQAYEALHTWCEANGYRTTGPSWEIYGHWTEDESKLVTEIYHLVESGADRSA